MTNVVTADPGRNRDRSGTAWTVQSVAAILSNPRYTGRQVWNRQHTDRDPRDRPDAAQWRQWNPTAHWVVSKKPSHPALVSERDFVAAQTVNATRIPQDGITRQYQLVGLASVDSAPADGILLGPRLARLPMPATSNTATCSATPRRDLQPAAWTS